MTCFRPPHHRPRRNHPSADRPDNFVIGSAQQLDPFGFFCEIYVLRQSAGLVKQRQTHQKEEVYVPLPW
jgi:hypothetical protein